MENQDYRLIPLTQGQFAIVDAADYEWLMQQKWNARWSKKGKCFYVTGKNGHSNIYMHRHIMGTPKGLRTDHRNHNPLDNRRGNLRIATPSQNNQNARISSINSSGFKGVWYDKRCKRWATAIKLGGKRFFLGRYKTSELASEKYKEAAIRMFGEFACAGDGSPFPEVPACNPGERKGEIGS